MAVAGHAPDGKTLCMLLMPELDIGSSHGRETRYKLPCRRLGDRLVYPSNNVVRRGFDHGGRRGCASGGVADDAGVGIHPIAMAIQALPVIRAFEAGHADGGALLHGVGMAGLALGNHSRIGLAWRVRSSGRHRLGGRRGCGRMVMAGFAAVPHVGHLRVPAVFERNGLVHVHQLVHVDDIPDETRG